MMSETLNGEHIVLPAKVFVFLFDFLKWFLTEIMCFGISTCLDVTHYGFGELEAWYKWLHDYLVITEG